MYSWDCDLSLFDDVKMVSKHKSWTYMVEVKNGSEYLDVTMKYKNYEATMFRIHKNQIESISFSTPKGREYGFLIFYINEPIPAIGGVLKEAEDSIVISFRKKVSDLTFLILMLEKNGHRIIYDL